MGIRKNTFTNIILYSTLTTGFSGVNSAELEIQNLGDRCFIPIFVNI